VTLGGPCRVFPSDRNIQFRTDPARERALHPANAHF
jgi:hypothetical protein